MGTREALNRVNLWEENEIQKFKCIQTLVFLVTESEFERIFRGLEGTSVEAFIFRNRRKYLKMLQQGSCFRIPMIRKQLGKEI